MDKDLIREVDEITKDMPKLTRPEDATDACDVNDDPSDSKKHKTSAPKSGEDGGAVLLTPKETISKKGGRRSKNPFLIFAKEQRHSVKSTPKNHKSTILGNMWQLLDYSEKKKYLERAKAESALEAAADASPGSFSSDVKPKKRRKSKKKVVLKKYRQPRGGTESTLSKKKEARSSIENTVDAVASGSSSVAPEVPSVTSNPSDPTPCHHVSQQSASACSCLPASSSCFANPIPSQYPTHLGAFSEPPLSAFGQLSSASHSVRDPAYRAAHGSTSNNFPQPLCPHSASDGLVPNQAYFGGLYKPYFPGMPGFCPPDPLSYFWIYQQSMFAYNNPYAGAAFCHSHCPCSGSYGSAYQGNPFRSFFYGQSGSAYPSFGLPSAAAAASHRDDRYNEREAASDNENNLVIVDDEGNDEVNNKESQ